MTLPIIALALATALWGCAGATQPTTTTVKMPNGSDAEGIFARAQALLRQGDTLRAEQYLLLAVRSGLPEERAILPLVQACVASSRLRAALNHLQPFLRKHPEHVQLRYLAATLELALGHHAEALRELERVTARSPGTADAHYLAGVIERDAFADDRAARARFETYLALAPRGEHAAELNAWLSEQPRVQARPSGAPAAMP